MTLNTLIDLILPRALNVSLSNWKILAFKYGQYKSAKTKRPVDANGDVIPWYTYSAIEFLAQFDYSADTVFEYGVGNSSLFWAIRAKEVISVEDNEEWINRIKKNILPNQRIVTAKDKDQYIHSIETQNRLFDIVVIDGKYRYEAAKMSCKYLREKGFIILDNSDWYPNTCAYLRKIGLHQIDFYGFGPVNGYTWCTSLFFEKALNKKRHTEFHSTIGGIKLQADDDK